MQNVLAISIIVASLLLSGTIFLVGNSINQNITGLSTTVKSPEVQGTPTGNTGTQTPTQTAPEPVRVDMQELVKGKPVLGQENAIVTIVEFSDFQCPFCESWFQNVKPQLQPYIDRGEVKLLYAHFPLSFHENAEPSALAAECANEQGKFWEYHDKVFENQADMSGANYAETLKNYASGLGMDAARFNSCFDSSKYLSEVQAEFNEGVSLGVNGTPTFFINGQKIVGAQPWTSFKSIIDAELAKAA